MHRMFTNKIFVNLLAKTSGSDVLPLHWLVGSVLRHFKASPAGQIEGLALSGIKGTINCAFPG